MNDGIEPRIGVQYFIKIAKINIWPTMIPIYCRPYVFKNFNTKFSL